MDPSHREVRQAEQHVHSFLETFPFGLAAAVALLRWDAMTAVHRPGNARPEWRLRPKDPPLSARHLGAISALVLLFGVTPFAEEMVRCWRRSRAAVVPQPSVLPTQEFDDRFQVRRTVGH